MRGATFEQLRALGQRPSGVRALFKVDLEHGFGHGRLQRTPQRRSAHRCQACRATRTIQMPHRKRRRVPQQGGCAGERRAVGATCRPLRPLSRRRGLLVSSKTVRDRTSLHTVG